jgi:hypothetical protein
MRHRVALGVVGILLVVVIALILAVHWFGWDWTGLTSATGPTLQPNEQYRPAKTLWDWLQLLIVPLVLAIAALLFNLANSRTERQIAKDRSEQDRQIAKQRYEQDQQIAKQHYEQDQQTALDKQREDLLQAYLDRIAELLLEKQLSGASGKYDLL